VTQNWYLIVIVAGLTLLAGIAAFYISVFSTADAGWFQNIALMGFGGLVGLAFPKGVPG
jgi:hypothetical protein